MFLVQAPGQCIAARTGVCSGNGGVEIELNFPDDIHAHSSARAAGAIILASAAPSATAMSCGHSGCRGRGVHRGRRKRRRRGHSSGGERIACHTMWEGWSNMWLSLATFFGPEPGSRTSCTTSDCVISTKLCPRNVQVQSACRSALAGSSSTICML